MTTKNNGLKQWLLGGGAMILVAAGTAWGTATVKLNAVDQLKVEVATIRTAVCNLVTLKVSETTEQKARALQPALDACSRQP